VGSGGKAGELLGLGDGVNLGGLGAKDECHRLGGEVAASMISALSMPCRYTLVMPRFACWICG
jgi:hypothetical protein